MDIRRCSVIFAGFTFFTIAALAQQQPAATASASSTASPLNPVPGQVITLTPEPGFHNEPVIAVNIVNPSQLFAAYQMPAAVGYSQDGGSTWKLATGTAPSDYRVSGDVSVTYDKHGAAILCYIAFDKLGTENYWARGATRNGIFVRRSVDGGATWESARPRCDRAAH